MGESLSLLCLEQAPASGPMFGCVEEEVPFAGVSWILRSGHRGGPSVVYSD